MRKKSIWIFNNREVMAVWDEVSMKIYFDMDTNNDIYRRIHFAVMAIESGARKLGTDWVADDLSQTLLNREDAL